MKAKDPVAVVYARVSTARQADDGLPVESQLGQCHAKALSLGGGCGWLDGGYSLGVMTNGERRGSCFFVVGVWGGLRDCG